MRADETVISGKTLPKMLTHTLGTTLSSFLKNIELKCFESHSCCVLEITPQNRLITAGTGEQENGKEGHQINIDAKGCEKTNPKTTERMMSNLCIRRIGVGVFCRI